METITPSQHLIKDTLTFHLNTQLTTGLVLNGDYKSRIQFDLKSYVNLDDDDIEYATVGLPNCVITNSNYIVNENNSKLLVTYGGVTTTYTVPYANYTKATWTTYVNGSPTSPFPNTLFTLTSDSTTNKFTITTTALFQSTYPSGTWGISNGTTCDYIFGLRTSFSTTANSYTFDRVYNFLPVARFVFHCNILSSGITMGGNSSISSCDVLAVIPNSSKLNSQIIYENNTKTYLIKSNSHISSITITITDDDNRLINFNGISCYFDLQFNIFRRSIQRPLKFSKLVQKAGEVAGQYGEGVTIEE